VSAPEWYVPLVADARVRLFTFPHAGAGCAQFSDLAKELSPRVGVWAANLPGRQARLDEPSIGDLDALVDTLADRLAPLARPPYLLFGYCGGALAAFLVARALRRRRVPAPHGLIVASYEAPDICRRPIGVAELPSTRLWRWLIDDGGVPAGLAVDARLRRVAEPAIRTDFGLLAGYRHIVEPPLSTPVTVCFGTEDPTPRGAWLGWRRHTSEPLRLRPLPGGHWLLDRALAELAGTVLDTISAVGVG
jgi:medium-chain acyl-[acyl-carrier-protein] hydrolase